MQTMKQSCLANSNLMIHINSNTDCLVCPRCLVDESYEIQKWGGEEAVFYSYISKDTVVRFNITYEALDKNYFFTSFFFSPSTYSSKWTETKNGEKSIEFYLEPMNISNEWVEFRISSKKEKIYVSYDKRKPVKEFNITQDAAAFENLQIWTRSISLCKEDLAREISTSKNSNLVLFQSFELRVDLKGSIKFSIMQKLFWPDCIGLAENIPMVVKNL
ncbi:unnamed protein product, partial [Meganyctiphanes norvegica]